jgi:hypothetical protein
VHQVEHVACRSAKPAQLDDANGVGGPYKVQDSRLFGFSLRMTVQPAAASLVAGARASIANGSLPINLGSRLTLEGIN